MAEGIALDDFDAGDDHVDEYEQDDGNSMETTFSELPNVPDSQTEIQSTENKEAENIFYESLK